jgi:hypothetical protein
MAKSVEERLVQMLAAGKNGTPEVEGAKELKLLKERNVSVGSDLVSPSVPCRLPGCSVHSNRHPRGTVYPPRTDKEHIC